MPRVFGTPAMKAWVSATDIFCSLIAAFLLFNAGMPAEAPPPVPPPPPSPAPAEEVRSEIEAARERLAHLRQEISDLEARLPALREGYDKRSLPDLREEIKRIEVQLTARKAEEQRIEERLRELNGIAAAQQTPLDIPPDRLSNLLRARAQERLALLETEKTSLEREVERRRTAIRLPEFVLDRRAPIPVMITKNRIVPIKEPYYQSKTEVVQTPLGFIARREHTRVLDGEPVVEALKSGGCLEAALSKMDPAKEHLYLLVCSDSISAYRAVVAELDRRGTPYTWKPIKDELLRESPGPDPFVRRPGQ